MRLGIMQPYFFPYLGYFDLIRNCDFWVVFDTPQYIRHGWVNRNRILHPDAGWQYVIVPLRKHPLDTPIAEIQVNDDLPWRERILGQLTHYRRYAPYYDETRSLVRACLETQDTSLDRLNVRVLEYVCTKLDIPFQHANFSAMSLGIGEIHGPGDWALKISQALHATEYLNPPGGRELFDQQAFDALGIQLTIRQPPLFEYRCNPYDFEPHLSIIDVLMWNSREEVRDFLRAHALNDGLNVSLSASLSMPRVDVDK